MQGRSRKYCMRKKSGRECALDDARQRTEIFISLVSYILYYLYIFDDLRNKIIIINMNMKSREKQINPHNGQYFTDTTKNTCAICVANSSHSISIISVNTLQTEQPEEYITIDDAVYYTEYKLCLKRSAGKIHVNVYINICIFERALPSRISSACSTLRILT